MTMNISMISLILNLLVYLLIKIFLFLLQPSTKNIHPQTLKRFDHVYPDNNNIFKTKKNLRPSIPKRNFDFPTPSDEDTRFLSSISKNPLSSGKTFF